MTNRIVVVCDCDGVDEIDTAAADGSDLTAVVHQASPDAALDSPTFSPDGQFIVFRAERLSPGVDIVPSDSIGTGSIVKIRADGTETTALTGGGSMGNDDDRPQWSRTGDRILFLRRANDDSSEQLYTMAFDGSGVQQLTQDAFDHFAPTWSPDGTNIAYASDAGTLDAINVFIVPAHGGRPTQVTRDATFDDSYPSWSPDGEMLAFDSNPAHSNKPATIWTIGVPPLSGSPGG